MSTRNTTIAAVLAAASLGAAGLGCMGLTAGLSGFSPAPVEPVSVQCNPAAPILPRGKKVRALVWNVQFSAGRGHHFFYDGGDAVSVPETEVRQTLDAIAAVVARLDPDLILWQELDRGSRRTHGIDQHAALLEKVPYPCTATTPYHRSPYVPHPPQEHLGKVDMHLALWSKYRIDRATRVDLPRLDESWLRQQFNLKRALLIGELPLDDGGRFRAFDSHLSAFSKQDGTLPKQLATIARYLREADDEDVPWLLGADLNSLPPGDDPARLGADAALYEVPSPLTEWFEEYKAAFPLEEHQQDPQPWRTYLPFGATSPDRAIDHIFHSDAVRVHLASVVSDVTEVSDHLPLIIDFELE